VKKPTKKPTVLINVLSRYHRTSDRLGLVGRVYGHPKFRDGEVVRTTGIRRTTKRGTMWTRNTRYASCSDVLETGDLK
jgi:hypothetical protein